MRKPFLYLVFKNKTVETLFSRPIDQVSDFWLIKDRNNFVSLKKRGSYPLTFLLKQGGAIILGYIEPELFTELEEAVNKQETNSFASSLQKQLDKEFLIIILRENPFEIRIYRDALCTIPLFYFHDNKEFAFSNEFPSLLPFVEKKSTIDLDFTTLSEYLLGLTTSPARTVLDKIKIITERSVFIGNKKGITIKYPGAPSPAPEINKKEAFYLFRKELEKTLSKYWFKIKDLQGIGFEVSGGLDSATALGFISQKRQLPFKTFSMILPGEKGQAQKKKINSLSQKFKSEPCFQQIEKYYPLRKQKESITPFYPLREIYAEALTALAQEAKKKKTEVMITGMGGDEAFILDPGEKLGYKGLATEERRKKITIPSFFSQKFKEKIDLTPKKFPAPAVPYSVLGANTARNNIYINYDIWPVAPLADPYFSSLCRALPKKEREGKKILRRYQKKKDYPQDVYSPQKNENFASFFEETLKKKVRSFLVKLFQDSCLDKMGLVEKQTLLKEYEYYATNTKKVNPLYFYSIAAIEIMLQSLSSEKR